MEPNYLDMSVDSLEASMARDILEASIRQAAESRQEQEQELPKEQVQEPEPEPTPKTDSETPKGADDKQDDVDHQTNKPLDQSLNLMDLSFGPALTAGSSVESPNLGPATFSTRQETEADDSNNDDSKRESVISVVSAEGAAPATEVDIASDSSSGDASDQKSQNKLEVTEETREEVKEDLKEELEEESKEELEEDSKEKVEKEPKEEEVKEQAEDKEEPKDDDDEESCESDRVILDDDCSEEDEEISNSQTQQQPSFQTAAGGHSVAVDPSLIDQSNATSYMEFTKNYSDDLLMGGGGQTASGEGVQQGHDMMSNADLADFELPPYSGSSSGSENQQHQQQSSSPIKSSQAQAPSSATASSSRSHTNTQASPPSLTALIELLMTSYSRGAHLLQWKRPIETGAIFCIGATFIMALTFFSIISVIAYSALGLILASASIRLYKTLMKTINKSTDTPVDHIWNKALAMNVSISSDKLYELVDASQGNLNSSLAYFKQVLLIEDKIAAIKFGIFLYILTYIGSWFNGMTLITIGYLALFSVPILYQQNKTKIDELLNLITGQMSSTIGMVTSRVSALAFGGSASDSKKKN